MVEVQIRTPVHNEEAQSIEWRVLAVVRAQSGAALEIEGDRSYVPLDTVVSVYTGRRVDPHQDVEEWARNLPFAYRAGDLVAVVRRDDDPPPRADDPELSEDEPMIPEAPVPEIEEAETPAAEHATTA